MRTMTGNESYVHGVISDLGFQKIKRQPGGFLAICKFHDDHHPSFSISDSGLWICFACGVKGNLKQLHDKLGVDGFDWKSSLKIMGIQLNDIVSDVPRKKKLTLVTLPKDFEPYDSPADVPAVIAKRLEWSTITHFMLGACSKWPNKGRCIIPVSYKKRFIGYHGRDITGESDRKYLNPTDFKMKHHIFNYDGCQKGEDLIIVEGAFNAMSMREKGFPNTIATFGTQFGQEQLTKIFDLEPSSIIICFDRDPSKIKNKREEGRAGQRATVKLGSLLDEVITTWVMALPAGKDPNNLPAEALRECHEKRFRFDRIRRKNAGTGAGF